MAKVKVRYFVEKPGRGGTRRYFWQPSKALHDLGWRSERLSDDRASAIARADQLNAELDTWRTGARVANDPPISATESRPAVASPRIVTVADNVVRHRSIAHLIREYKASRFYLTKAKKTQSDYRLNLNYIEAWAGDMQVTSIGKAHVQKLYEKLLVATPGKANAIVTMLRILLRHGERLAWIKQNAADKPGLIALPFSGKIWPIDAISLLVETADRLNLHSIGTAVVVNHWLGQRENDILDMKRTAWRGGRFHIEQKKTNQPVSIPHSPWVEARIEAEFDRQKTRGVESATHLILSETTGQPWKQSTFQKEFARVRKVAADEWPTFWINDDRTVALGGLWFMHLRHTAATELAIAGCSVPQIAAITGHTLKSVYTILRRYLVMTAALADEAVAKRLTLDTEIAALVDQARAGEGACGAKGVR